MNPDPSLETNDSSTPISREGRRRIPSLSRLGAGLLGLATGLILPGLQWRQAEDQLAIEREKLEDAQARAAPRFEFTYMVLPPPASMGDNEALDARIAEYFGGNNRVQTPLRSVNSENLLADSVRNPDSVRNRDIFCESTPCEETLASDVPLANEYVYLFVKNVGGTDASDIAVEFESTEPWDGEVQVLDRLFSADGTERFSERIGDVASEGGVLVPLASVAIVNDVDLPRGFVGVGDTRRPLSISWREMSEENRATAEIREPSDSIGLIPALGIEAGG